jgi:hypothetical protein
VDEDGLGAATGAGSVKIFMSYRRADDRHFIGRLHDRLCDAFGDEMVFRDIDSIPAGTNFRNVILRTLNEVDAVVAIIGPQWSRSSSADRASAATDYVFLELAEALREGKPVLPVLIEDTEMPTPDALPADLRALSDINAISVHGDPAFRRDSTRLIEAIGAIVAEDRARVARQLRDAEEQQRQVEAERLQRERVAEELRAEERAARARLAELEEAATRRQIEQERARLEDLERQLRQAEAEASAPAAPAVSTEPPPVEAASQRTATPVEQPRAVEPVEVPTTTSTARTVKFEPPWLQMLLIAALSLGVVALSIDRRVEIGGSIFHFSELGTSTANDATLWVLTLAIAVPLFLGSRQVEQRSVLAGVVVASFCYELLQASATVRYGADKYDEGSWFLVKILEIGCLSGAYWIVRKRSDGSRPAASRYRIPLMAIATASGVLLLLASHKEWSEASGLIGTVVPDRTPFSLWVVLLALPPTVASIVMAKRGTDGAYLALATLATLGALSYVSEASFLEDSVFRLDGSAWRWLALSQLILAGVAWWAAVTSARSAAPSA